MVESFESRVRLDGERVYESLSKTRPGGVDGDAEHFESGDV